MKNIFFIMILSLIISCTRNIEHNTVKDVENSDGMKEVATLQMEEIATIKEEINNWDNYDWITEYDWSLDDGRYYIDPSIEQIDWIGNKAPFVKVYKFDIPSDVDLYQVRLRDELFYFLYQTEDKSKLFSVGYAFGTDVFELIFNDDFTSRKLYRNGYFFTQGKRVGEQINSNYPLVGIWGSLPSLSEYKLINPVDCLYYMEINKEIPRFGIREGTYLLKKTGDKTFETISSFPDGHLRLELINARSILITPLFTLPDEKIIVGQLIMSYNPNNPSFSAEEE